MNFYDWEGEQLTIDEISARTGIKATTIRGRLSRGICLEQAARMPVESVPKYEFRGERLSIHEIRRRTGVPREGLTRLLKAGQTADEAVEMLLDRKGKSELERVENAKRKKMAVVEQLRAMLYGRFEPAELPISRSDTDGRYSFGDGLYRFHVQFLGENQAVLTAVFRKTGEVSNRWEYAVSTGGVEFCR